MPTSFTTTSNTLTLPGSGFCGQTFYTVLDIYVTQNVAITIDPGVDGQRLGLRFWTNQAGWQVTAITNYTNSAAGPSLPYTIYDPTTVDYLELMYVAPLQLWMATVYGLGLPIPS